MKKLLLRSASIVLAVISAIACIGTTAIATDVSTETQLASFYYDANYTPSNEEKEASGFNAFDDSFIPNDFITQTRSLSNYTVNETELNDSMSTADTITDGQDIYGILGNNTGSSTEDIDYYKITLAETAIVNFWIECDVGSQNYHYVVYTTSGMELGRTSNNNKLVVIDLAPGTYYIAVYGTDGYTNVNQIYHFRTKQYFNYELDVQLHEQESTWTCGTACAVMILDYFGEDVTETEFLSWTSYDQTYVYRIVQGINHFLNENLYTYTSVANYTLTEYNDKLVLNLRNDHPIITQLYINNQSEFPYNNSRHYVLVRGITYNPSTQAYTTIINDPHYDYPDDCLYVSASLLFELNKAHSSYIINVD